MKDPHGNDLNQSPYQTSLMMSHPEHVLEIGLNNNYEKRRTRKTFLGFSSKMLFLAAGFGVLLIFINIYQLYHLSNSFAGPAFVGSAPKNKLVWIYSEQDYFLKHVLHIFNLAGYKTVTSLSPPPHWDVMWAYLFPFKQEFIAQLANLAPHQMVNHLPGTGYITLKVELATTDLRWIPPAYSIPKQKNEFILAAERSPSKRWIQKSNNHRGIKIISSKEVNLDAADTFIQEFLDNPLLIDEKKFDIGVYVVYTSVDPLQVYIYNDEMLLRFCTVDYHPFEVENTEKYVVGDDYIPWTDMPSLKSYHIQSRMSAKNALFEYLKTKGYDTNRIWNDIGKCIAQLFISKSKAMDEEFTGYHSKTVGFWNKLSDRASQYSLDILTVAILSFVNLMKNYFELVRVDFAIDDSGKVWLMEVNMSPNLSSDTHPGNALMYQQVIYNTLSLVGVASHLQSTGGHDINDITASDEDIMVPLEKCKRIECLDGCPDVCRLCNQCLSDTMKTYIKKAYREHKNRGSFHRILPLPLLPRTATVININAEVTGTTNELLALWFREKCRLESDWCQ